MYKVFTGGWRRRGLFLFVKAGECVVSGGASFIYFFPLKFRLFKKVALQGGEDNNNNSTIYIIFTQHFKLETCQKEKVLDIHCTILHRDQTVLRDLAWSFFFFWSTRLQGSGTEISRTSAIEGSRWDSGKGRAAAAVLWSSSVGTANSREEKITGQSFRNKNGAQRCRNKRLPQI